MIQRLRVVTEICDYLLRQPLAGAADSVTGLGFLEFVLLCEMVNATASADVFHTRKLPITNLLPAFSTNNPC